MYEQLKFWPAQERVVSPLVGTLVLPLLGLALLAALAGSLELALSACAALIVLRSSGILETELVAQLDQRYAVSGRLALRLRRRQRRQQLVRRLAPLARRAARWLRAAVGVIGIAALGAGVAGAALPAHPEPELAAMRVISHALCYAALAAAALTAFTRQLIRDWDRAARSHLCASPLVTAAEVAVALRRDAPTLVLGACALALPFLTVALR